MGRIEQLKRELLELTKQGDKLRIAWIFASDPTRLNGLGEKTVQFYKSFDMVDHYQRWYSKAVSVVRQLIPDRLDDFTGYYQYKGRISKFVVVWLEQKVVRLRHCCVQ